MLYRGDAIETSMSGLRNDNIREIVKEEEMKDLCLCVGSICSWMIGSHQRSCNIKVTFLNRQSSIVLGR